MNSTPPSGVPPVHSPEWLHDLRNAVNAATISAAVVRRFLESGEHARAMEFVSEVEAACERCRILVMQKRSE